jgi:hypothetical protein
VRVEETGSVNELKIENLGDEDVYIQSGDIVKGGRQDRALTVSFILPKKSGAVPEAVRAFLADAEKGKLDAQRIGALWPPGSSRRGQGALRGSGAGRRPVGSPQLSRQMRRGGEPFCAPSVGTSTSAQRPQGEHPRKGETFKQKGWE